MIADIPELKARDRFRGMARQDSPRGRDVKGPATPTTNTRLWKTRVIVRQHRVDYDATPVDAPEVLQLGNRMIYLVTRGHQRRAVLQGPAVVLHVRNCDALRFQRDSETISPIRVILARCTTALIVSGRPSRTTSLASACLRWNAPR